MLNRSRFTARFFLAAFVLAVACGSLQAQRRFRGGAGDDFGFRFVGPVDGNRVSAITGITGDSSTYYAGVASGGVWKSTDGGNRWRPIFDDEPVEAIGALAVAPSDPNVVWAGTGEAWAIRDIDVTGNGVYKSTDSGKTIEKMLGGNPADKARQQEAEEIDGKMQEVEYNLLSRPLAASDEKTYISAWKVYYNLLWLNGEIGSGAGDVAGGTDFRPTDTEVTLAHQYEQDLSKSEADYHDLMTKDISAFNHTLVEHNTIPIVTSTPPASAPSDGSQDNE